MGIKTDWERTGLSPKKYIQLLWAETSISPSNFDDLDTLLSLSFEKIKNSISPIWKELQSQDRKNYYQRCLQRSESQVEAFVRNIRDMAQANNPKDKLAKFLSDYLERVLLGELLRDVRPPDVLNGDITAFTPDLWEAELNEIIDIDEQLGNHN